MALQAYPDVPLFRYPYTDLSLAQIEAALARPANTGPGGKGSLDNNLSGKLLNFTGDGGNKLAWTFGAGNRVTFDGKEGARVVQRWDVGHRVRDIEEAPDGSLWMLEDANPGGLFHLVPK